MQLRQGVKNNTKRTSFFLSFNVLDDSFYLLEIEVLVRVSVEEQTECNADAYGDFSVALHNADLDVLRAGLYDFQQTLHCELDAIFPSHVVFVVLFQKFTDGLRRAANSVRLSNQSSTSR